jgi:UDP-N-acetylglucosamine 2-epimerase (non-hydrolysing)
MAALDRITQHTIIHTGQNYDYELSQVFFKELNIRKPDFFLEAVGKTAAETIGLIISRADEALRQIKPDALLVLVIQTVVYLRLPRKDKKFRFFTWKPGTVVLINVYLKRSTER